MKCKSQGHEKDHCSIFSNYIAGGGPRPLNPEAQAGRSTGLALWCAIYQVAGKHATNNYHLLQKNVQALQQLLYNFFRSVGHDEHSCRSYELMMERNPTYRV